MRPLWLSIALTAGRARTALVVASTALVSGLLLVAVSYARLWSTGPGDNAPLLGPIADPGTRGGAVLGVVLLTLPLALLLDQCVRLGSAAQRRRYEALSVAGATRRNLRRWGAVETGLPALVGAVLGVVVWLLLRLLLGHALADAAYGTLVPTATGPGWWALLVLAVVAAYGVLVGRRAAARAAGGGRRERPAPRPWGPVVLVVAVLAVFGTVYLSVDSELVTYAVVLLIVVGLVLTTPWLAYVISGRVSRRTEDPAVLLATRRIRADRGAAARAAAAVGAVGLALGVVGVLVVDLLLDHRSSDLAYYLVPTVLSGVLAVVALGVITLSMSLHSIETTLERRREMSALVATGVPVQFLERATRVECRLVTLPVTVGGSLLGALFYGFAAAQTAALLGGLAAVVVAAAAVLLAVRLVSVASRPWLREAAAVVNLRTG